MSRIVVDASVVVKWVLPNEQGEQHAAEAVALAREIQEGTLEVVQPPHWLAEVAAVLTRLRPADAPRAVALLHALELPVADGPEVWRRACELGARLDHHVLDTLYHAVALVHGAELVTADERYFRKATPEGRIRRLGGT